MFTRIYSTNKTKNTYKTSFSQSPRPIRITMTGTWLSSSNVGDNAIMVGIVQSLMKYDKIELTVISSNPDRVNKIYNIKSFSFRKSPFKVLNSIRKSNALFFTGGTPFYNDTIHMLYFAFLSVFAKLSKTRIIIYGISLRKLSNSVSVKCIKLIAYLSSFIGAREYASFYRFGKLLPNSISKIFLLPDPAIQIVNNKSVSNLITTVATGLDPDKPWVAICPRNFRLKTNFHGHHYSIRFKDSEIDNYISSLIQITNWLVSSKGYQVVFIPMHVHFPDDDRAVALEVLSGLSDDLKNNNVFSINDQYDPHTIISFLSYARFVIGVRFHSLVLSFTCHTPVISIGYAGKNKAIMEYLNLPDYSFSLNTITFEDLQKAIVSVEENEALIKENIQRRHLELKNISDKELLNIISTIQ